VLSDVGGVKAAPKSNANREEAMSAKADAKNAHLYISLFALIIALFASSRRALF